MAANNYYGFDYNATGNQYSTVTGSSGYATGLHAQHAMPTQSAYPPSQTTVQYGPYGTRNQTTTVPTAQGYGGSSERYFGASNAGDSFYSQKSSAQSAPATYQTKSSYEPTFTSATQKVSSSDWQPQSKQTYSQSYSTGYGQGQTSASNSSTSYAPAASASHSSAASTTGAQPSSSHSGLDAAVYSAATNYLLQKQKGDRGSGWYKNFKGGRGPPDPSQWKYCELCKCTCAGIQAYNAHLVGKAHKKKELMGQSSGGGSTNPTASKAAIANHLYCKLCDVVCSSADAYAAHMRGSKHQRILKLQLKMGKPIPSQETPEYVAAAAKESKAAVPPSAKILKTTTATGTKRVFGTPRISFVGGTQLQTTGAKLEEVAIDKPAVKQGNNSQSDPQCDADYDADDKDAQPIGLEYIEESLNETRTAPNFYCKLCDCSFTDPHAKVMHTKGRRHRLQYKKKVDPSLKVDIKLSSYHSRADVERMKRRVAAGEFWRKKELQDSYKLEAEDLRYEKELLQWQLEKTAMRFDCMSTSSGAAASILPGEKSCFVEMGSKRDAEHVSAKHATIYPTEEDLAAVQNLVSTCERSLKLVSDHLATVKVARDLKGVMRVGLLAKGLLLHDCLDFKLVVLCSYRPTQSLLKDIMNSLPPQLETFTEEKFKFALVQDGSGFTFASVDEDGLKGKIKCCVTLTSPAVNPDSGIEQKSAAGNEADNVDVRPCLKALAELRHAKWFQAKATNLYSCVIVIRIMMDFCQRVPTWSVVSQWSLELLVEKCISSEDAKLGPAVALRRLFEAVAGGILLPGGPGVYDPCEKTPTDAFEYLTHQEREDLTNSAQHAVRMMAFGDIHKILGMDPLPDSAPIANNKRKRASSS